MTVREMHIEVNQSTQAIAANIRRKMQDEELDWILNKVMLQYIGTHAASIRQDPAAAESITHFNRLVTLLDYVTLPTYKSETGVKAVLPASVQELLSVEPFVHNLCGSKPRTLRGSVGKHYLGLRKTAATDTWYGIVHLTIDNEVLFDMQDYTEEHNITFNGFTSPDELWRVRPLILEALQRAGYLAYWEKYEDEYRPDTIIIDDTPQSTIELNIDNVTTTASFTSSIRTQYIGEFVKRYPGRLVYQTNLPQNSASAFGSTYYRSPLCFANNGAIEVELDNNFIVRDLRVHCVRKPRQINVILGTNCELPESAHQDICDLATEYIKALREDPDWEAKLKHNMLRTTI